MKISHEQIDECDIETLIPKLAGATWLNHYLESLPNLEAQKQMCRQVISMRRSTVDICYTGMFDRGSLARHVQNCCAYADWTSTLVDVNCVNENFCLTFTQKFTTDRYVKAFRELLEQRGIACTEIEETEFI